MKPETLPRDYLSFRLGTRAERQANFGVFSFDGRGARGTIETYWGDLL